MEKAGEVPVALLNQAVLGTLSPASLGFIGLGTVNTN